MQARVQPIEPAVAVGAKPWPVLVVDDDPEVRQVTRLVLGGVAFEGRRIEILEAASAAEAAAILRQRPDIAVMLLDVVMETPQAGLELVRQVRQDIGNRFVRIVLRTGQPGEAPELDVVTAYDINDYREKTELTATRLVVTLYTALRSYGDLRTIEAQRRGLEHVIAASAEVFARRDATAFVAALLEQCTELLGRGADCFCCRPSVMGEHGAAGFRVLAGSGAFAQAAGQDAAALLAPDALAAVHRASTGAASSYSDTVCVLQLAAGQPAQQLLCVCIAPHFSGLNHRVLRLFGTNAGIAWANLHLATDLLDAQQEMVFLLASAAETRSRETASHVHRVGLLVGLLARAQGLPDDLCDMLGLAAPLHDIGKIGIPDPILNKPGPHTEDEARIMRTHTTIGARLLGNSRRPVMQKAAEIALTHHENWDGSGYPRGLAGDAIPISGRITMVADVFDALGSRRCYKDAWAPEAIRTFLEAERGRKFDPAILDQLFAHWDAAMALRERLPD
ncbi:MAG TPA: HD domain-containing phosphohydrolase [Rhodanobacteraceae bacterium]